MVAKIRNRAEQAERSPSNSNVIPRQNASNYGTAGSSSDTEEEFSSDIPPVKDAPVLWKNLPNKAQLAVLVTARLSEPLVQTSFQVRAFLSRSWAPFVSKIGHLQTVACTNCSWYHSHICSTSSNLLIGPCQIQ